ncbi:hypothetical protein PoB_005003100 [Plakobranchus ocellatus]|uniref:Ig-like domain-containing protein n=1 Tax=Plakobranchus ocellatus TaxID=259542 RepID=A0AAV4BST3_9GAST|nr:hypothetical protein PoB_005003100 [Plakobranchus ocellatus]
MWHSEQKGKPTELADCYTGVEPCNRFGETPFEFHVTAHEDGKHFNSSMLIKDTPLNLDGRKLSCSVYDYSITTDISNSICKIRVYKPPKNVTCYVDSLDGEGGVVIKCLAEVVYPNIKCSVLVDESEGPDRPITRQVSYSKMCVHDAGTDFSRNCSITCTVSLYVHSQGEMRFRVRLQVQVDHHDVNEKYIELVIDDDMVKQKTPKVDLIPRTVSHLHLCPNMKDDQQPLIFTCRGRWLMSDPQFVWRLHQEETRMTKTIGIVVKNKSVSLKNATTAQSQFNLLTETSGLDIRNARTVSCELKLKGDTSVTPHVPRSRWARSPLNLQWPPEDPPILNTSGYGLVKENTLYVSERRSVNFTCSVPGGRPSVNSTNIRCWNVSSNETIINRTKPGSSVDFSLFGNSKTNKSICMCSASHVTGCYHLTAKYNVKVTNYRDFSLLRQNTSESEISPKNFNDHHWHILIVCFFSFILALVLVSFFLMKMKMKTYCKRRERAQNYEHSYPNQAQFLNSEASSSSLHDQSSFTRGNASEMLLKAKISEYQNHHSWKTPSIHLHENPYEEIDSEIDQCIKPPAITESGHLEFQEINRGYLTPLELDANHRITSTV